MTVGDFVLVNAYVVRLVQPLEMLGFAVRDMAQGLAFLGSLLDLFREQRKSESTAERPAGRATHGELVFEDVSFSYRQERPILQDVSFRVPAGRTVAVVGVSGSGKSSLIRLLFRLYEPTGGRILLDGAAIEQMPLSTVRQAIAVVPQDTVLFHDTIGNNIGFGRHGSTQQEIEEAARLANLHEFIVMLPEGYDNAGRRARPETLRRRAPACRDRARGAQAAAHLRVRRGNVVARQPDRARDPAQPGRPCQSQHDAGHRASAVDRRACR